MKSEKLLYLIPAFLVLLMAFIVVDTLLGVRHVENAKIVSVFQHHRDYDVHPKILGHATPECASDAKTPVSSTVESSGSFHAGISSCLQVFHKRTSLLPKRSRGRSSTVDLEG